MHGKQGRVAADQVKENIKFPPFAYKTTDKSFTEFSSRS